MALFENIDPIIQKVNHESLIIRQIEHLLDLVAQISKPVIKCTVNSVSNAINPVSPYAVRQQKRRFSSTTFAG